MNRVHRMHTLATLFTVVCLTAVPWPLAAQTDNDALKTKAGTPLKVIVRMPASIQERPDKGGSGRPADPFSFYYVLPTANGGTAKLQNGFYRIATARRYGAQAGWIAQEAVVEWPPAQVLGFRPLSGRALTPFFGDAGQVETWYKGNDGIAPLSRESAQHLPGSQLFPLLDVSSFEHKRDKVEVYKVAYLHAAATKLPTAAEPKTPPTTLVTRAELERDFVLQVVFVLDTTASMEPFIEAVKKVIATAVDELARDPALRGRIHFGLVCYRDQLATADAQQQIEYLTKIVCDLKAGSDHREFLRRLADVHEARISSEDTPEDVLAGLKLAIKDAGWQKTAFKHIVLVGDASCHTETQGHKNPDRLTIPGILALAQPTGSETLWQKIQIHGLRILGGDDTDHALCKEHFDQLTAGRDFPGIHGQYAGDHDAPKFIADLGGRLRDLAGFTGKVVAGKADELVAAANHATPGSDQRRLLGPVLEMLRATGEGGAASAPTFTQGYAAVLNREGNRALEPHVLVTHGRLALFASALDFTIKALEEAGEPGNRDVQKVVTSLQILATNVNLGEAVTPDMPLDKLLSLVLGFPVRNPIFAMTPAKLAAMTARDFQGWVQQVRASETIVNSHLENGPIWFSLGDKPARHPDRHAFVKVSDLP